MPSSRPRSSAARSGSTRRARNAGRGPAHHGAADGPGDRGRGLAAERRTSAQLAEIGRCLKAVERRSRQGESAVDADFAFHKAIFAAVGNPYFLRFLEFLGRYIIPRQSLRAGFGSTEEQQALPGACPGGAPRDPRRHQRARARAGAEAARLHLVNSMSRYRQRRAAEARQTRSRQKGGISLSC